MGKFFKPKKALIFLQRRYSERNAMIVRPFDDRTRDRPYGHYLVPGGSKYPKKVIHKDSQKKQVKKLHVKLESSIAVEQLQTLDCGIGSRLEQHLVGAYAMSCCGGGASSSSSGATE